MLQTTCIGHIGADAESKSSNGKEFIVFRIANTERWKDDAGQVHENTTWVDCIMDGKPNVFPFLKKGQMVFVNGSVNLRVYSSAKDRCMKAGLTINVRQVELLGVRGDDVPALLYSEDRQKQFKIEKYFWTQLSEEGKVRILVSRSGERFIQNEGGFVFKEKPREADPEE